MQNDLLLYAFDNLWQERFFKLSCPYRMLSSITVIDPEGFIGSMAINHWAKPAFTLSNSWISIKSIFLILQIFALFWFDFCVCSPQRCRHQCWHIEFFCFFRLISTVNASLSSPLCNLTAVRVSTLTGSSTLTEREVNEKAISIVDLSLLSMGWKYAHVAPE